MLDLTYVLEAVVLSWRFFLCTILSVAAVTAIFWLIPDRTVCVSIAVVIVPAALLFGFLWQWRSARRRSPR